MTKNKHLLYAQFSKISRILFLIPKTQNSSEILVQKKGKPETHGYDL